MDYMEVKKITFEIPKALATKFKSRLAEKDEKQKEVLKRLIERYLK